MQPSAQDARVLSYVPLVERVVETIKTTLPPGADREGLFSAGMIGLIQALERYDDSKGVTFEAFARLRIRGAVRDELRGRDHLTRSQRKLVTRARAALAEAEASGDEIDLSAVDTADLDLGALHSAPPLSWDPTVLDDKITATPWQDAFDAEEWLATKQGLEHLQAALRTLPERERTLVSLYYDEELSLAEIGGVYGISPSRVSQLLARARTRLARVMTAS